MDRFDWMMVVILAVIVVGLVVVVFVAVTSPLGTVPQENDHKILATEISRLHNDVRLLQTQVGPKQ